MDPDINKIFGKIYVLTIERNRERHPNVESVLKNIDFEILADISLLIFNSDSARNIIPLSVFKL